MGDCASAGTDQIRPNGYVSVAYKITIFADKACNDERFVDRERIALDQDNEPAVEELIDAVAHHVEVLMYVEADMSVSSLIVDLRDAVTHRDEGLLQEDLIVAVTHHVEVLL